jgi:hypothetical protein
MTETDYHSEMESEHITNYLLGVDPGEREKKIYAEAMQELDIRFSKYETELWNNMLRSKWRMASIDAGLALTDASNNSRRKIYTMLGILEASPAFTAYFLSRNFSRLYIFRIIGTGIRAIFRAGVGIVIIKLVRRKCR